MIQKSDFAFMKRNEQSDEPSPYDMYGMEIGDGWMNILMDCCRKIQARYDEENLPVDFRPIEIKEKYGELSFDYEFTTKEESDSGNIIRLREDIERIIESAIEESTKVCECCGAEAELRNIGGIYLTRCDKCMRK